MNATLLRARRGERGTASLELIGLLPVLGLVAMLALQVGIVGWTVTATSDAAWAAARAASLQQDPQSAARDALPGSLEAVSIAGGRSGDGYSYTVTVKVPSLVALDLGTVSRAADVPAIP